MHHNPTRLDDKLNLLLVSATIVGVLALGVGSLQGDLLGRGQAAAQTMAKANVKSAADRAQAKASSTPGSVIAAGGSKPAAVVVAAVR